VVSKTLSDADGAGLERLTATNKKAFGVLAKGVILQRIGAIRRGGRLVAAATALAQSALQLVPTSSRLEKTLALNRFGTRGKWLAMNEAPWYAVVRCFGLSGIVTPKSIV
jgi:hypothetical protein